MRGGHDRLLPETRWACLALVPILAAAWLLLWVLPNTTDELWAWPIEPEMTPLFMGALYGAGAFMFGHAVVEGRWHALAPAILPVAAFATLMAITTFVHWDRFDHDAPLFYAWTAVYLLSPLIAVLWLRNRDADPGPLAGTEPTVPGGLRALVGTAGVAQAILGGVFFFSPQTAIDVWPWQLTELTARVLASFMVEGGLIAIALYREPRWGPWRLLSRAALVGTVLVLVGAARAWEDFDHDDPLTWVLVAGLATALVAIVAVVRESDRRSSRRAGAAYS